MKLLSTKQLTVLGSLAFLTLLISAPSALAATPKTPSIADEVLALEKSGDLGTTRTTTLPQIARQTMALHFGCTSYCEASLEEIVKSSHVDKRINKPAGVFVTLTRNGKTRGCWGSVYPQYGSVDRATVYATIGALTKEYRYAPIKAHEWSKLRPQVTVVRRVEPINSISGQDPLRDGLLVRSGGKSGVLLPGEASDAYYQLVQCKLKAGIASGESCQLYRLKVEIYD
jgi:AMMECR1 domain-containing protein